MTCPFGSCFSNCSKHHSFSLTASSNICLSSSSYKKKTSTANYHWHIIFCNGWYCASSWWFARSFSISPAARRQENLMCFTEPYKKRPNIYFQALSPSTHWFKKKKKSLSYLHLFTYYIKCYNHIIREY